MKHIVESGKTVLGIELGTTRIKAVLMDLNHVPFASGSHVWENRYEDGYWTYSLENIWTGLQDCYRDLRENVEAACDAKLTTIGAIGFSAMMHGYMAFNAEGELLVPFRTWRNGTTGPAAKKLTELFNYNIPQRWSIAHLYQAVLNEEEHVSDIAFFTTLAGYIHWKLTGKKVLGIGDASGMFPIDTETKQYNAKMLDAFDDFVADREFDWKLRDILPQILLAGDHAGCLTEEGAKLLDASGMLQAGIPCCPPEGDAGTGMAATNSVALRTGNVSAGTSVFSMIVLEHPLNEVHPEIDLVTTPAGDLVAMVHANNCTSDLNGWASLMKEFAECFELNIDMDTLYNTLFNKALEGEGDCGGLLSYGYVSGENITGVEQGRPLFVRSPESHFTLANFMRMHIMSAFGTLKVGMDLLQKEEGVQVDEILAHGGMFKTPKVGQQILADAIDSDVTVMETAGEGGAWGIGLLAAYMLEKEDDESLENYLNAHVFAEMKKLTLSPEEKNVEGYNKFMTRYREGIAIEKAAEKHYM